MRRLSSRRLTYANVASTAALFLAMSGTAAAAVIITSTSQIAPAVRNALMGRAIAVDNEGGLATTSLTDTSFHSVATLGVPAAGDYTATAKVVAFAFGGAGDARALCDLTAHSSAAPDSVDTSYADLQNTSDVFNSQQTIALEVAHDFAAKGTIVLSCQQNGLGGEGEGALLSFSHARIIARQAGTLTVSAVTH
jgi:hypothetical protein